MNIDTFWFRSRWLDGRHGHSLYLMFALTFVNFILIAYRYLIESETELSTLIDNLWLFGIFFLVSYIPASIIIGYWHRKTQLTVENVLKRLEDPLLAKMFRTLLDTKTGSVSDEELENFRKLLLSIERQNTAEKT